MNKKLSSSFHRINYDKPLSKFNKIMWFLCNFLNNQFKNFNVDKNIKLLQFDLSNYDLNFDKISFTNSPLRYLSDLFLYTLPWKEIIDSIGRLKIIEMGCGRGIYGSLLNSILNKDVISYNGIDISQKEEWKNLNSKFNFYIDSSDNISKYIEDNNFIFTITAIEHFENDLRFFREISKCIEKQDKPVLQLHIMPAYPCLKTYLGHGVRQYNLKNISKITKLFSEKFSKYIVPIGNKSFNDLTFDYITIPRIKKSKDKRYLNSEKYKNKLINLLTNTNNSNENPTAYALIIASNFNSNFVFKDDKIF